MKKSSATEQPINTGKKITISDIAQAAGVSVATVSRVVNQTGIVKESTYKRVSNAITSLGYEIDKDWQSQPGSGMILMDFPSTTNPFYTNLVKGAKMSASQHGYHLLINEDLINEKSLPNLQTIIKKARIAGMITCNQIGTAELRKLSEMIPIVQCGEYNDAIDLPYVSVDDVHAAINVVEYLFSIGKKRIALLNGPEIYKYARHRLQGYQMGLETCGLPFDPSIVITLPDVQYNLAISTAIQLINSENPPDAFFACADVFAIAALRAIHLTGYQVPKDFSVVGFDNIDVTASTVPSITTVSQPQQQLGFTAGELLHEKIQNSDIPPKKIILETELIIRESTK